jgi:hypothetical protein
MRNKWLASLKQLVIWINDPRMMTVYLFFLLIGVGIVFFCSITTKPPNLGHWCHNYIGIRFTPDGKIHPVCLNCLRDMDQVKISNVPVKDL